MMLYMAMMLLSEDELQFIGHLHRQIGDRLVKYAFGLSGDEGWAQDAAQRAFAYVIMKPGKFRGMAEDRRAGYLMAMIKHEHGREMKRRSALDDLDGHADTLADARGSAEDEVIRMFERAAVRRAVARLPDNQREALMLRYGLGFSHREVAERMGISVSRSQNLCAAAIGRLRRLLYDQEVI